MASNSNYFAVTSSAFSITPAKAAQAALTVTSTSAVYGVELALATSGGSGNGDVAWTVVSGTCTRSGSTLTPGNVGSSCVVRATKASDANYLSRSSSDTAITTAKGNQTGFSITSPTSVTTGSTLNLTASGGQSGGAVDWSVTNGTCTLSGARLAASRGGITCTVTATKAGNANYLPVSETAVVTVNKIVQTLIFRSTPPNPATVGTTYTVSVDSDAFLAATVVVANQSQSVCSISVGVVTFTSVGTCLLSASQSGSDVYSVSAASQSITVVAAAATQSSVPTSVVATVPDVTTTSVVGVESDGTDSAASTTTTTTTTLSPRASGAREGQATATTTTTSTTTTTTVPADPTQPQTGIDGGTPDLEVGQTTAMVRGQQVEVSVRRDDARLVLSLPNDVSIVIGRTQPSSDSVMVGADGMLRMYRDEFVDVAMTGFVPGTIYTVFMFSEATELTRGEVDADGAVSSQVLVPKDAEFGEHTIQVNGVGPGGEMVSVSMGFEVLERTDNTWMVVLSLGAAVLLALLGGRPIFIRRRTRNLWADR
jgi:hypothetical protein